MKRYSGNSTVRGGFYFNTKGWNITAVSGKEGVLEGSATDDYVRLPLVAVVVGGAAMSIGYCMFLPFIGFALVLQALGKMILRPARRLVHGWFASATTAWQPGEAHFTGEPATKERAAGKASDAPPSESLEALKGEIASKRAAKD